MKSFATSRQLLADLRKLHALVGTRRLDGAMQYVLAPPGVAAEQIAKELPTLIDNANL